MLCVLILYICGGDLLFEVDSERQICLRNFSWQFLFTLRVFARNLLKGNRRRNTFRISFYCLVWDSNSGFSSNKPTHYLLDWLLQPISLDYDLVSYNTYVVCINFYIGSAKYLFFWKCFQKTTEYFLKFFFYLKIQSFRLIMENNFIQMAASAGHAVAYMIGTIFDFIWVRRFFNGFSVPQMRQFCLFT